jgi:protein-L-isoaspartate(D-aspartate) O-methyltransferase
VNSAFDDLRDKMVERQLKPRGIRDPKVLASFCKTPRHQFVPAELISLAYADGPLPIGFGQTISQPYIVALMTEAAKIRPTDRVLEIGTGSGYQAAILSPLAKEVYTIERLPELAKTAEQRFHEIGLNNIAVKIGDGSLGLEEEAPFDVILVTAGAPVVPASLIKQLKAAGRLILPVGDAISQQLLRICKQADGSLTQEILEAVRFVPLIGKEGWENGAF